MKASRRRCIRLLPLLLLTLIALLLWHTHPATATGVLTRDAPSLRVHFIDVGQADSILIQMPDGATALIDGGGAMAKQRPTCAAGCGDTA
jgi:beta-lactamase superfamily II metal-dependent hydrolase